jgi:hypothetical protein
MQLKESFFYALVNPGFFPAHRGLCTILDDPAEGSIAGDMEFIPPDSFCQ